MLAGSIFAQKKKPGKPVTFCGRCAILPKRNGKNFRRIPPKRPDWAKCLISRSTLLSEVMSQVTKLPIVNSFYLFVIKPEKALKWCVFIFPLISANAVPNSLRETAKNSGIHFKKYTGNIGGYRRNRCIVLLGFFPAISFTVQKKVLFCLIFYFSLFYSIFLYFSLIFILTEKQRKDIIKSGGERWLKIRKRNSSGNIQKI